MKTTENFKDTNLGRALRTFNQALIVVIPIFLGIVALPEVQSFIAQNVAWIVPALAPIIATVTYLYNRLGK